ncbi:hypothetical protein [Nocardia higoensis]|uniref:hypothetical protein n=1 Tax=Nocardia higoensis TaxID=228599 RepID=UPI0012F65870|nr:hypothetical protein [Nocardia higoensis]
MKLLTTAVLATALIAGTSVATANAETPTAAISTITTEATAAPTAILVTVDATGQPIAMCMMPGDTLELRAGIGAAIGALAGLPIFIIGAIPAALVGAGFGALSWWIADQQRHRIPGPC